MEQQSCPATQDLEANMQDPPLQRMQRSKHRLRNQKRCSINSFVFSTVLLMLSLWCCSSLAMKPPEPLVDCLRHGQHNQLTTYQDFVDGKATRLTLASGWWSSKPAKVDLTVVTGLTVSRLDQLEAQCRAWRGNLVASVYLVLHMEHGAATLGDHNKALVENAAAQMDELHARLEADPSSCSLGMMLLVETVSQHVMKWMLPINVLRNYALLAARSRLVAMVDVDLLPSAGLAEWLEKPGNLDWLQQQCSQKKVFVLPAFETAPLADTDAAHKLANQAAAQDKQGLLQMVEKGQLWQFALKIFKQGHNCTDYPQWFTSQEAYGPVGWTKDYEPWFIADRTLMPFYDSVFRGYGWNKVTQVTNVHHQGFQFMVHPTGFLVHRQHSYSKAGTLYQASKKQYEQTVKEDKAKGEKDTSLAGTTHKFRNRVLDHLAEGSYQPVLDGGLTHCLGNLPWWREGQQLSKQQQQTPKQLQSKEQLTQEKGGKDVKDTAEASGGLNRKHMRVRVRVQQESSLAGPGTQAL